jgi:hypothetical protein
LYADREGDSLKRFDRDSDIADDEDGIVVVVVDVGVEDTVLEDQTKWGGVRRRSAERTQDLQEEHEAMERRTEGIRSVAQQNERREMQQATGICAFFETKAWRGERRGDRPKRTKRRGSGGGR